MSKPPASILCGDERQSGGSSSTMPESSVFRQDDCCNGVQIEIPDFSYEASNQ